jgi:hypothetical protein
MELSDVAQGVDSAFYLWLADHCVSVPEMFESAIERAVTRWMDANEDQILEAITKKMVLINPSESSAG